MEKSLIGRRYVVRDNSYSKDLSGNCLFPTLAGQEGIIIHNPYTECVKGRENLFVDIVIPNNFYYKHHYRVLFREWGLLDKGDIKLDNFNTIYCPDYNASHCRMLDNDMVEGYLLGVNCEILSSPYCRTFQDLYNPKQTTKKSLVIDVRSLETGIEYCIDYRKDWVVKDTHNGVEDSEWNFCPHCGKKLR